MSISHLALAQTTAITQNTPTIFQLPEGKQASDYFVGVNGALMGLLLFGLLLSVVVHRAFVKKDGNMSQALGWIAIIVITVFVTIPGANALHEVVIGAGKLSLAWVTTS
jgi:hypothetical protein